MTAGYMWVFAWSMEHVSYDIWGGLAVAPVVVALTIPWALRTARREGDPRLAWIVVVALLAHLAGSIVRYFVAFDLYGGQADATSYHIQGTRIAESLRLGQLHEGGRPLVGTGFIQLLTGVVYTVIGPTKLGGFFVFSALGFAGLYFFYRAFAVSFPEGNRRRYALFVFLLPSLLFWPSSIGKEAWMTFSLGLTAYGVARLTSGIPMSPSLPLRGLLSLSLGLVATALVRPHVTLLVFAGIVVAYLIRRAPRSALRPVIHVIGLLALVIAGLLIVTQVKNFLDLDDLRAGSVEGALEAATERTTEGGSSFTTAQPRSPTDFIGAGIGLLFRPLPTEAKNAQMLLASLEGVFLLVTFVLSWRRLLALPRSSLRVPYVAFVVTYAVLFIVAFSSFGNFGIIARQRVQLFPFVLVLIALPLPLGATRPGRSRDARRRKTMKPAKAEPALSPQSTLTFPGGR